MPRINLLDWRHERRERRKKHFINALGGAVVGAAAVVYLGMWTVGGAVEFQNARNRYLEQRIKVVEHQMREIKDLESTKARLIARMRVIERLQQNRSQIVHFFDQIVDTLPDGVYLKSLQQTGGKTIIDGVADSNGRVSTYLKNLDASPWFEDPRLIVITAKDLNGRRVSAFTLQVKNTAPTADEGEKEKKTAATSVAVEGGRAG